MTPNCVVRTSEGGFPRIQVVTAALPREAFSVSRSGRRPSPQNGHARQQGGFERIETQRKHENEACEDSKNTEPDRSSAPNRAHSLLSVLRCGLHSMIAFLQTPNPGLPSSAC
jgi:hypothetical protein